MWIFILEAAVALGLLLLIVWGTWPRRKPVVTTTANEKKDLKDEPE